MCIRDRDITEALWGSKVSPATISELNKKAYVHIEAVSYTHLLRTAAGRAAPGAGKTSNRLGRSTAAGRIQQSKGVLVHAGAGAVSYTHLDVYKRQLWRMRSSPACPTRTIPSTMC